jgi:hypothetical protein
MQVRVSREEPNCDAMTENESESFDSRETTECAISNHFLNTLDPKLVAILSGKDQNVTAPSQTYPRRNI